MTIIKTACVQITSGPNIADNLKRAEHFIRDAAGKGAVFIATPENTCRMRGDRAGKFTESHAVETHPAITFFSDLAAELKIYLLIGSISSIRIAEDKLVNRSFLFNPQGNITATYDKIHMFDAVLPNGEVYKESDTHQHGTTAVVADMNGVKLGLSVCYDLRFPHLFRALAKRGAQILSIPAAFTVPTGKIHWDVLMRARAIENGAYVVAPAQCGIHDGGRGTWGHSVIVSPWGDIISQAGSEEGVIIADLNMDEVAKARAAIPSLQHDREYDVLRS